MKEERYIFTYKHTLAIERLLISRSRSFYSFYVSVCESSILWISGILKITKDSSLTSFYYFYDKLEQCFHILYY